MGDGGGKKRGIEGSGVRENATDIGKEVCAILTCHLGVAVGDASGSCPACTKEAKTGQKLGTLCIFFFSLVLDFVAPYLAERTATLNDPTEVRYISLTRHER
jgi:hypothetical protein